MMKKLTLTLVAVCFTSMTVWAQSTQLFRINYSTRIAEQIDNHVNVWVNQDFTRIAYPDDESQVEITDKKNNRSFILVPQEQQYLLMNDGSENDFSDITIEYLKGQEKNIAGYPCKLAKITFNPDDDTDTKLEMDVWYTEKIPAVSWLSYNFLAALPGAALSFMVSDNGFIADDVKTEELATTLLAIPENYTEMEIDSAAAAYDENQVAEDRYLFSDEDGNFGLRNDNNDIIMQPKYSFIAPYQGEVAIVNSSDEKQGAINLAGQEIIPLQYDYLTYSENHDKFLFGIDDKYGLLDADGKIYIPAQYDMITFPTHGLLQFTINYKTGLMNEKQQIIIPAIYETLLAHNQDYFVTMQGLDYVLHAIKGNKKITGGYEYIGLPDQGNIFLALKKGKYGYINDSGKTVIPFKYATAMPFENNMAMVSEDEDSFDYYFIDKNGVKIVAPEAE